MRPPLLFRSASLRFTKGGAARLWFSTGNSNCRSRGRVIVAERRVQISIARNRPLGYESWQEVQAKPLGLMHTLRSEGRPKKTKKP